MTKGGKGALGTTQLSITLYPPEEGALSQIQIWGRYPNASATVSGAIEGLDPNIAMDPGIRELRKAIRQEEPHLTASVRTFTVPRLLVVRLDQYVEDWAMASRSFAVACAIWSAFYNGPVVRI